MIKRTNRFFTLIILSLILVLAACNSNVVYTESVTMKGKVWPLADRPVFRVPVTDTLNSSNIFFTIRTGSDYPFRNIYLFVTATSPEGSSITDTLQYYLADEKGNWYGRGFGDIHELSLPYKSNVFFPMKGEYVFRIQHAMRTEDLGGVYDIGLRIERISK